MKARLPSSPPPVYVPAPLSVTDWTGGVVEARTGYVHPFATVTEYYTDNLFNTNFGQPTVFVDPRRAMLSARLNVGR